MSAIEIKQLNKIYRGKKGTSVEALVDLNLTVEPGEVLGFLGPNGAGKSTTIKILTGQISPSSGYAKIQDVLVPSPLSRRNIGYLPESPSFFNFMTALEYLRFVGKIHDMTSHDISRESDRVLELLELGHAANRPVRGYSKGMIQRLGLAQAMLHNPDLYILDEPMSGLDPLGRALVKRIVKQLKKEKKTVFFSTHITSDVEEICDRVAVLVSGRLCALENVDSLLQRGIDCYHVVAKSSKGKLRNINIDKNYLKQCIDEVLSDGYAVESIEPVRKNLEAFFLETVKGANNENR